MYSKLVLMVVGLLVLGCSSDDSNEAKPTDGTLAAFQGSVCKKESVGALTAEEAYAGLQCIRWKAGAEGTLHVDLVNFEGACGAQWKGEASKTEAGLELRATNPGCLLAACGWCIYDWTFDVQVDTGADVPLSIVTDPCPGEQTPETDTLTLPLASLPAGELCRYANYDALGWQAAAVSACGKAFMPCRSQNGMCQLEAGGTPCEAGLSCATGAGNDVCHATCTGDADCALPGVLTCQSGLCRPANSW